MLVSRSWVPGWRSWLSDPVQSLPINDHGPMRRLPLVGENRLRFPAKVSFSRYAVVGCTRSPEILHIDPHKVIWVRDKLVYGPASHAPGSSHPKAYQPLRDLDGRDAPARGWRLLQLWHGRGGGLRHGPWD